jgi:hypothetical protein
MNNCNHMNTNFDHRDTPLPTSYFEKKYQLSRVTLWRYRRAGLTSVVVGNKAFIRESEFVEFLYRMNGLAVSDSGEIIPKKEGAC